MNRETAIRNLHDVLVQRRDALRRALTGDLSMLNELRAQPHGDMADFALDAAQDEISSQLAEVESRELEKLENALSGMQEGVYGKCEGCGEDIPLARLHALPYATHCIQCQRESEKGGRSQSEPNWGRVSDPATTDQDVATPEIKLDAT